jgi:enoyl-CoA hydratase/carnithine racemase
MSDAPVTLEIASPVARLILNRPGRLNALDMAMWGVMPGLLDVAAADPQIKILLVSGADERAFAAGADILEFARISAEGRALEYADCIGLASRRLAGFPKPTIAVIQGPCVGGGCGIAMCCDFRFADTTARIGVTAARLGIAYPLEDTRRLINVLGLSRAREMLMTARVFHAEDALEAGLVDRVLPADRLWQEAMLFAETMAGESQFSIRAAKAMIAEILAGATSETEQSRRLFGEAFANADLAEGARAFAEKRRARFTYS